MHDYQPFSGDLDRGVAVGKCKQEWTTFGEGEEEEAIIARSTDVVS